MKHVRTLLVAGLAVTALQACSKHEEHPAMAMGGQAGAAMHTQDMTMPCKVSNVWVRSAGPELKTSAAYLTLEPFVDGNLVGVISDAAGVAEIHSMTMDGDVMRMRKVDSVPLKKGMEFDFKPNGYHIMLMDLKGPLTVGQTVNLQLFIETAAGEKLEIPVKATVADQPPMASMAH